MPISPLKSPLFEPTRSLQIPQSEIQLPSPVTSKTESSVSQEEPGVCKGSLLLSRPAGFKRVPRKEAKDNNRTRKRKNEGTSRLEAHFQSVSDQFRSQDDDERDIVYDPKTETLPDLPMYHPDFALAEGRTKEMIRQLQLVVSDSTEENAELKHMLTHLHNLQDPTYPRPSLVCFLGSSGVGKSCLINSLLDIDGLSLVSSGSVGTLVPITYQAALENQETRFVAQMELFPIDKCESLIKLSLKDYWNHFLKPEEEEGPRDTDQIDLGMPAKKLSWRSLLIVLNLRMTKMLRHFWRRRRHPMILES
ncbi:hypothetical protein BU24DRAFT_456578 [Aaosphaeria arxii CBS 175.79]|uniref:Uncharacterized protein n=1 Tax=Aaosphaeria arxii CBS 175.79 TaxID=1450172 RepID=A0A6A5Y4S3_9PLEO|nr:uncharacterized protein BU24DRAFT_456578 [Aaosphaeria arxii CBS 175.79]KAF2020508.1 hypothetical protein BU24DRAFT_456578 [Aaosphaeria arxii CBS 175.79]